MASMSPSPTAVASMEALYKKLLGTAATLADLHPNSPEHTSSSEAPVVAESSNSGWKRTRMASEEGSDDESIPKRSRKATSESPNSISPKPTGPKDKSDDDDSDDNNNDGDEFRRFLVKPANITTTFADVCVSPDTIKALQVHTLSLYNPSAFTFGVLARSSSPGVLLYGPPGTGKTLLVKALAKQTHATFLTFSSADIRSKFVGEGEKKIKRIFAYARKHHPCIVFIDEADSLFRSRSAEDSCRGHLSDLNQFLEEMEGIKSKDTRCPMVIAATNRPFDIDEGILRRLRKRILVDVPDARAREQILKIHLRGEPIADDVDLSELVKELAKTTQDYTGSDLETLVHEAAIAAEGENQYRMRTETPIATASSKASHRVLRRAHFVYAKQVVPASPKSDLVAKIMEFHNKFGATTQRNGGASGRAEVMNKMKSSVSL